MKAVSFAAVLALLLVSAPALASNLSVQAAPAAASVGLGTEAEVKVTVKNAGTAAEEALELVHDIRSVYLEIRFKEATFEYARVNRKYFDFIFHRQPIAEYLAKIQIPAAGEQSLTLKFLLPEAGTYRIRGVYCGAGEALFSDWTDIAVAPKDGKKIVKVMMKTTLGDLKLSFRPDKALGTVINFLNLVSAKFFDGVGFHRIIKDFMNQGGDPEGTGQGGPGYFIPQEFNGLPHLEGTLSMARTGAHVDTAGSQFFLCAKMSPELQRNLNRQYTVFGNVEEGLDVVGKINGVATDPQSGKPKEKVAIEKAEIVLE